MTFEEWWEIYKPWDGWQIREACETAWGAGFNAGIESRLNQKDGAIEAPSQEWPPGFNHVAAPPQEPAWWGNTKYGQAFKSHLSVYESHAYQDGEPVPVFEKIHAAQRPVAWNGGKHGTEWTTDKQVAENWLKHSNWQAVPLYLMPPDAAAQIAELKAENTRLTTEYDQWFAEASRLRTEIAQLQARLHEVSLDWQTLHAERDKLQAEVDEQCRLNGMGSEREAALIGKVERLEAENAELQTRRVLADQLAESFMRERDELEAENAEWKSQDAYHVQCLSNSRCEVAQLTAALRRIADYEHPHCTMPQDLQAIARDALGERHE